MAEIEAIAVPAATLYRSQAEPGAFDQLSQAFFQFVAGAGGKIRPAVEPSNMR